MEGNIKKSKLRKYKKGEAIKSLDELASQDFVILNNKVYNKGWFQNWQLHWIELWISSNRVYKVLNTEVDAIEAGGKLI